MQSGSMLSGASSVSFGVAFVAGVVSFLSPCVLPLVPSYVTFVTGVSLDELTEGGTRAARRNAAVHAALFVAGFSAVFVALGATATAFGMLIRRSLPLMQQVGGVIIVLFGLSLLGVLRLPIMARERRVHLASRPAGYLGSVLVGLTFGAAWTPCVGPVLASVLLYAGMEPSMTHGMLLLSAYALGLGVPFFAAAVGLNWFLAGSRAVRLFLRPIEVVAGAALVVVGALLVTGRFSIIVRFLAGFGQLINVPL